MAVAVVALSIPAWAQSLGCTDRLRADLNECAQKPCDPHALKFPIARRVCRQAARLIQPISE
jgi:hypothetical protein